MHVAEIWLVNPAHPNPWIDPTHVWDRQTDRQTDGRTLLPAWSPSETVSNSDDGGSGHGGGTTTTSSHKHTNNTATLRYATVYIVLSVAVALRPHSTTPTSTPTRLYIRTSDTVISSQGCRCRCRGMRILANLTITTEYGQNPSICLVSKRVK